VVDERCIDVGVFVQARSQREGVLQRQLGPRTNRAVSRVRGVPDQDQVAIPPAASAQSGKADPAAVVGEQGLSAQRVRERVGAECNSPLVALPWFPRAFGGVDLPAANPALLGEL